jgi:hypothetical protein
MQKNCINLEITFKKCNTEVGGVRLLACGLKRALAFAETR